MNSLTFGFQNMRDMSVPGHEVLDLSHLASYSYTFHFNTLLLFNQTSVHIYLFFLHCIKYRRADCGFPTSISKFHSRPWKDKYGKDLVCTIENLFILLEKGYYIYAYANIWAQKG